MVAVVVLDGAAHPIDSVVVCVWYGAESVSCIESIVYIGIGSAHAHDFVVCMAEIASIGTVGVLGSVSDEVVEMSHALDSGSCRARVADIVVCDWMVGGKGRLIYSHGSFGHFGVSLSDVDGISHTSHCRVWLGRSEDYVGCISSWGTVSWSS